MGKEQFWRRKVGFARSYPRHVSHAQRLRPRFAFYRLCFESSHSHPFQASTRFPLKAVCFRLSSAIKNFRSCRRFAHPFYQVEYALEAIKLGSTSIGIQTAEVLPLFPCAFRAFYHIQSTSLAHFTLLLTAWQGVVLAVEKRITSPLLESSSVEKIIEIDR